MPIVAVLPSSLTHSWSLVYFKSAGKFISICFLRVKNKKTLLKKFYKKPLQKGKNFNYYLLLSICISIKIPIMKKLSSMLMIVFAAFAFQACNHGVKDSKEAADSANHTKDTSTNPSATGGIAVDKDDAKFVTTAANDGMAEVAAGKMAQEKAVSSRVKSFAAMMVTDHTKAGDDLAALAKTKNITLPAAPDADAQKKADDLSKKTGNDFDKAYVNAMVDGHKKAVSLFEDASKSLKDADLRAFAIKTLPTLKMHLDSINAIHKSMK
jgi:putative membrane protein